MEGLLGEKKRVVVVGGGAAGSLIAKTLQDHADVFLIDFNFWGNFRGQANFVGKDEVHLPCSTSNGQYELVAIRLLHELLQDMNFSKYDHILLDYEFCPRNLRVKRKEFYEIPWTNLRSMVEPSFAERTVINHSDYLPNAHVITSAATNITQKEVLTAQGRQIAYDYLVIATGHVDSGPYTKAERLSHYEAGVKIDRLLIAAGLLLASDKLFSGCRARKDKVREINLDRWGGPTGVELAAEIIVDFPDKKVTLVHRGSRLLEFIGEKAGKKAMDWLNSKKVEVILGQSVKLSSVSDGAYETSGGETIIADCHFLCTGNPIGSSWLKDTLLKDNLDMHGRLMVDANLRVRGHNNIFAIGDITDIPEIKQGYLAQAHALVAAKNLRLLIKGENDSKMSTYRPASPMALVSLGRREGVAQVMCLTMGGRVPGMIKSGDLFVGKTRKQLGLKSTLP
ncbi:hypothetical protein DH2020_030288 [Rehmannia glutinosa]|uniref:FAD/NAD(P)-binding domain-containing protein n=1 Tax=Rehmannia glutinosa TaxID=99300 RepID=A0ABR0VL58_REHGL